MEYSDPYLPRSMLMDHHVRDGLPAPSMPALFRYVEPADFPSSPGQNRRPENWNQVPRASLRRIHYPDMRYDRLGLSWPSDLWRYVERAGHPILRQRRGCRGDVTDDVVAHRCRLPQ